MSPSPHLLLLSQSSNPAYPQKEKKKNPVAQIKKKFLGAGQTFQDSTAGAAREQDSPYKRGRAIGLSTRLAAFLIPRAKSALVVFPCC